MRKRRTRNHILADLSANHFERFALLCGYAVERVFNDYGVDLLLFTYAADGEIENESVKVQLKATDNLAVLQTGQTIAFPVRRADLELWLGETLPVILVVYDAPANAAYWIYVQAWFQRQPGFDLAQVGETMTIRIDRTAILDENAIRQFAFFNQRIIAQTIGVTHDEQ